METVEAEKIGVKEFSQVNSNFQEGLQHERFKLD
jgi:hypothetical protein